MPERPSNNRPSALSRASLTVFTIAALGTALVMSACTTISPPPSQVPTPSDVVHAADDASTPLALALLGADALRQKRLRDAIAHSEAALLRHPFLLEAGLVKVEAQLLAGQRSDARAFAERLRDAHPDRVEAHYAFAKSLFAIGRTSQARAAFDAALDRDPTDFPSRLGLLACVAVITTYDLTMLVPMAETLLADHPDHAAAIHHQLAIGFEQRGDPKSARHHYERALQHDKTNAAFHYNFARLVHDSEGFGNARPHYQRFLELANPTLLREREAIQKLLAEQRP